MPNKILLAAPVTQSREAVKQLIKYFNHGQDPAEMPEFWRITANMVLVQSNKKDAYFVTMPHACSCPAATYNHEPCVHQRQFFPQADPVSVSAGIQPNAEVA